MQIEIKITQKRAELQGSCVLVCGNSGDTVNFIFDNEWGQYSNKTARFGFIKEGAWYYSDVLFDGSVCEIPMLSGIDFVEVGVYAGNLSTTTPARVPTKRSILCRNGLEHEPPPADVYNEILAAVSGKLSTTGGTVTGDYYKDGHAFIHEGNLDLLDKTDNVALVKTATGNALTIESANAPFNNLKVLGITTQDGTPTPTSPIELKSVGDSGSYSVDVYGGNILKFNATPTTETKNGITFTINDDNTVTANGTATANALITIFSGTTNALNIKKGVTYSISDETPSPSFNTYYTYMNLIPVNSAEKTVLSTHNPNLRSFTCEDDIKSLYMQVVIKSGVTVSNLVFKPMICIGETPLPYEPFNKQSLTLTDTLRGVGEYTDEKDFAKGVKIQRMQNAIPSNFGLAKCTFEVGGGYFGAYITTITGLPAKVGVGISSHFPMITWNDRGQKAGVYIGNYATPTHIFVPETIASDVATLKQWLIDNDVKIYYPLKEPIETPLTETELNAYRQLMTNKGTTTVLSEATAEATFYTNKPNGQALGSVHAQINKDYFKLQQAIIALGGSTL